MISQHAPSGLNLALLTCTKRLITVVLIQKKENRSTYVLKSDQHSRVPRLPPTLLVSPGGSKVMYVHDQESGVGDDL